MQSVGGRIGGPVPVVGFFACVPGVDIGNIGQNAVVVRIMQERPEPRTGLVGGKILEWASLWLASACASS
jgi:hypothetical protein